MTKQAYWSFDAFGAEPFAASWAEELNDRHTTRAVDSGKRIRWPNARANMSGCCYAVLLVCFRFARTGKFCFSGKSRVRNTCHNCCQSSPTSRLIPPFRDVVHLLGLFWASLLLLRTWQELNTNSHTIVQIYKFYVQNRHYFWFCFVLLLLRWVLVPNAYFMLL